MKVAGHSHNQVDRRFSLTALHLTEMLQADIQSFGKLLLRHSLGFGSRVVLAVTFQKVDIFEKWYADQDIYRKVTHIPTAEELENDYICLQDAADLPKDAKIVKLDFFKKLLTPTLRNSLRYASGRKRL